MKVLVTGGSGFLGINLIRYLLSKKISVVSLDILDFNYPEKDRITAVKGDIRDPETVDSIMAGTDIVIHTAAALPLYKKDEIYSIDIGGTGNVIASAFRHKVKRFIHISTTAVYGTADHFPIYEDDRLIGVGPYGKAKIQAEQVCLQYRQKGMTVPIIRPKSFIGPERLGVFSLLYSWAYEGRNFPMIGSGKNRYQFLDVEDLCEAIYLCMTLNSKKANDTFNIGAKEFTTMREDYQSVLDYAGHNKKITGFPVWPAVTALRLMSFLKISPIYKWVYKTAYKDSAVSIEKAEKILGFSPKYSNKDALLRNYIWYIENRDSFIKSPGITHRVPWKEGLLKFIKVFF